ncbi:MAG: BolA family protein, partial [Rickettsiales bacterium]
MGLGLIKSIGSGDDHPHLWFNDGLNFGDELVSVQQTIESKINEALSPSHLQVLNESHMHSVPPGSESHFKVVIVSESFEGVPRVRRHQTINGILKHEIAGPVHALSMETLTQEE